MNIARKPPEGEPCTRCGICCLATPCGIGMLFGAKAGQPCHMLLWNEEGLSRCGALEGPMGAVFADMLGVGHGCDSGAADDEEDDLVGMTAIDFLRSV